MGAVLSTLTNRNTLVTSFAVLFSISEMPSILNIRLPSKLGIG